MTEENRQLDETHWSPVYRCICGADVVLEASTEVCNACQRPIMETAHHDLSMTTTLGSVVAPLDRPASKAKRDDFIGKELGHFKILEVLGRGGMGDVYKALDTSLQRYVAVKVLNRRGTSAATNEHLMQEAIAQARVNHENVVTIYYVGKHENNSFLAMELVSQETLGTRLKSGPIPYDEISSLAIQVVGALNDSHKKGIVHGDIKPNNILLSGSGKAKLSDFGMSRMDDDKAKSKAVGGTPNYLAPELLDGEQPTIQSDMYALGVTLFEMTFGRLPVQMSGTSVVSWKESHQSAKIDFPSPLPPHLPSKWPKVLTKLLSKNPEDRYESYDELLADLQKYQPISSSPARAFPRAIAYVFDFFIVFFATAPFLALLSYILRYGTGDRMMEEFMVSAMVFIPFTLYLLILVFWRQSVGRFLMSIRVVNQYRLPPSRVVMLLREVFRQTPLIITLISAVVRMDDLMGILAAVASVVLLISCVAAMFNRRRRTLHDLVFKTQVILDVRN